MFEIKVTLAADSPLVSLLERLIDKLPSAGITAPDINLTAREAAPAPVAPQTPLAPPVYAQPGAVAPPAQLAPVQAAPVIPIQAPAAPTVPTSAPTYTLEQLATAGAALVDAGKMGDLLTLLSQFGVAAITDLKLDQYGAFATALRGLGAKI